MSLIFTSANATGANLASTLEELLGAVCIQFRPAFRRVLAELRDLSIKASHAQEALRSFEAHQAAGTFPPAINSLHPPLLQCSKEFVASSAGAGCYSEVNTTVYSAKTLALSNFVSAKQAEVAFFSELISPDEVSKVVKAALDQAFSALKSSLGGGDNLPPSLQDDYNALSKITRFYGTRAVALGFAQHRGTLEKRMKKLKVKDSTEVEMTDQISTATIEKVVEQTLKRHSVSKSRKRKNTGESRYLDLDVPMQIPNDYHRASKKARCETSKGQHPGSKPPSRPSPTTSQGKSRRERAKGKEEKEVQEMMDSRPLSFSVRNGASYPDSFVDCSFSSRFNFIVLNSSLAFLSSVRTASPGVFKGPDVFLPPKMEYFISLNLKHIFHQRFDLFLPLDAFLKLERSIRIRYFFRDQEDDGTFMPQFHVKSNWEPPRASDSIESGLKAGKNMMLSQLNRISPLRPDEIAHHDGSVHIAECKNFLRVNQYLVLNSDKNLGCAVVSKEWYDSNIINHLNHGPYDKVDNILIDDIGDSIQELPLSLFGERICKYLHHPGHATDVPRFYGIPKIHKNPWAIRPISPAHSWITSPLAKVLNHFLSPLIDSFPTITTSTISFVKSLQNVAIPRLGNGQKILLCKGDVRSMYTNIKRDSLIEALEEVMIELMPQWTLEFRNLIIDGVKIVNESSFFTYQNQMYWQRDGLAMGSPIAPLLANIYMGWYERCAYEQLTPCSDLLFYKRYIDDIYAMTIVENDMIPVHFRLMAKSPGLFVDWEYSNLSSQFLDVRIWLSPGNPPSLHTCLWEKKLSHYQYIPWSTAHPRSVLKGFIKAELLRILTVCSEQESFTVFRQKFFYNLHRRGYPIQVLKSWFSVVTWNQRNEFLNLRKAVISETPMMLPSHYNPVWDHILVRRIEEVMKAEWARNIQDNAWIMRSRIITSLARVRNLFDYTRNWNKAILEPEPHVHCLSPSEG
jgi:hypothetical protein